MSEEKEIKILLSDKEYDELERLFKWSDDYMQINYYYGSEEDIVSKKNTYRVREKNGKIKMQVKVPYYYDGSLHCKMEYEKEIEKIPDRLCKEELTQLTGTIFEDDKDYIGNLLTRRKVCTVYSNIEICLDMNVYLEKVDYEIEIEFRGEYPHEIIELLEKKGINTQGNIEGKNTRYMRTLIEKRTILIQ